MMKRKQLAQRRSPVAEKMDAAARGLCAFAVSGGAGRLQEAGRSLQVSVEALGFTGLSGAQRTALSGRCNPAVVRCADGVLQIVFKAPEVAPGAGQALQQRLSQRQAVGQLGQALQEAQQEAQDLERSSTAVLGLARRVLRRQLLTTLGDEARPQEERGALLKDASEVLTLEAECLEAEAGTTDAERHLARTLRRLSQGELLDGELLRGALALLEEREAIG